MAKKNKTTYTGFFEDKEVEGWRKEWKNMPEYEQEDKTPMQSIMVHFTSIADRDEFSALVGQVVTPKTRSLFYPPLKRETFRGTAFCVSNKPQNPKYPVYIISKGRWESRLTSKSLEEMNVPYHIVIEPQEYEQYAAVIAPEKILVLPFSNLGQGSIPARNWVWEHSVSQGAKRHWILDDNLRYFFRINNNIKYYMRDGTTFRVIEDFVDRYENIGMAGMQYFFFYPRKIKKPPISINTRIYSCILIDNTLQHKWRGRYNEDTDLSLRTLKSGWCTVLFNAFLCGKQATMRMKGGNTDILYQEDGRQKMADSLIEQHPDLVTSTQRWGRIQHLVDYTPFQNVYKHKLKLKKGVNLTNEVDNYGMQCILLNDEKGEY